MGVAAAGLVLIAVVILLVRRRGRRAAGGGLGAETTATPWESLDQGVDPTEPA